MQQDTGTLKSRYTSLATLRDPYLRRGRVCAEYTIPALLPPEGSNGSTTLPTPYQSMGARGVNNLAAKLLLTLFPPNTPFFRFVISDYMLEQLTGREGLRALVEEALDRMERAVMFELEATSTRPALFEGLRQLIVAGNVLLYMMPSGGIKVFRLDHYVVKRSPSGEILEIVVKETVSPMELPESIRGAVKRAHRGSPDSKSADDTLDLYTGIKRINGRWEIHQEVADIEVPGSRGHYPLNKSPWLACRFTAIDGEDYGRGYVEEYIGDIISLEQLAKAIVTGSAAMAKVLFLVRPNSSTDYKTLAESESGDIRQGNAEDVTVLQMQKHADFRVAAETAERLKEQLAFAFLLNSAVQRNGERVTAEEIRFMANELEAALGGTYSTFGQELQLPLIRRLIHQMERQGKLPALPEGVVQPAIVTGIDALGRGNDLTKLSGFAQDLQVAFGPDAAARFLNPLDFAKRLGAARGIDMKGLVPTQEEFEARQQTEQLQAMVQQLGPNVINQAGGLMKEAMPPRQ